MKPYVLSGHTRPLTCVKYNTEGDLLFSCSKDNVPTLWYTDNGERVGTYDGHTGTVWWLDPNRDSTYLLTGGADMTVKIWSIKTGEIFASLPRTGPVRQVEWAEGSKMFLSACDSFRGKPAEVAVYAFNEDKSSFSEEPLYVWNIANIEEGKKITVATWTPLNKHIVTGDESGTIRIHDPASGKVLREIREHTKRIMSMQWNKDKTLLITGAADCLSLLFDAHDWTVLKRFESNSPVNAAAISPIKEHVIMAGGQEAMSVTTTSSNVGKFETKFFHMVFGEHFGSVKGHFGPVNTLAIHPEGTGFTTGAEDGFIRVHQFDKDYYQLHSELDDLSALEELATKK